MLQEYGLWCWRLKIPMAWYERMTPRSRFGRVHVEFLTTWLKLSSRGLAAMREVCGEWKGHVSSEEIICERVPLGRLEELTAKVLRVARRKGNSVVDSETGAIPVTPDDEKLPRIISVENVRIRRKMHKQRSVRDL